MRVELAKLLAERTIAHPTRIEAINWLPDEFQITLRGFPWWRTAAPEYTAEGSIRFVFKGLGEGDIRPDELNDGWDEALENFKLASIAEVEWAQPSDWSIFCSGSIPDPLKPYIQLNDFLSRNGSFKLPSDFLNQAYQISHFMKMAQSQSFLLAKGPECVRALLCEELQRQGVPHNVIQTPTRGNPKYLVRLGDSTFLCNEAFAFLDPFE